ncbi:hypothetical protein Ae717Ps2_6332c [Pseudonocardia sp. Ae717_Ps2]|nr:hypothetical protein Ae717Ps2_6308c [Pseudonocardia sp. Ae717_Ps2]OLM28722.1 hypothetical protein Ae717Ps2_6320c [Pseudonocardia sp. Ae717_Ps2]OLM28734.1 hypothetical protein Ae717Ps2_6332c [Pseudonocardia sp. Ae717_Ps2]
MNQRRSDDGPEVREDRPRAARKDHQRHLSAGVDPPRTPRVDGDVRGSAGDRAQRGVGPCQRGPGDAAVRCRNSRARPRHRGHAQPARRRASRVGEHHRG